MSEADFDAKQKIAEDWGLQPIRIMGSGSGADTRFAVIWATDDQPARRKWKIKRLVSSSHRGGDAPPDPFGEFDAWMESYMKNRGVRAGQIAISRGGRLMCARAYQWAEPGFVVTPFTTFRIGSVSKVLTALATWQIIAQTADLPEDEQVTPETDVASAAKLGMYIDPASGASGFGQFEQMNVLGLLRHLSGARGKFAPDTVPAQKYTGSPYPLGAEDYLRYAVNKVTSNIIAANVGTYKYSNFGYFLLSEVVKQRAPQLGG
jgi:CubicO group peptidase (beta-lactamase class C family)